MFERMQKKAHHHIGKVKHVGLFMTRSPRTLESRSHLATAKRLMHDTGARHIPVLDHHKIVGMLSDRDIRTIEYVYRNRDLSDIRLEDVCLFEPYTVSEQTPLTEVLEKMVNDKLGSVIIEEQGEIVGVFTTTDACKALQTLLKGNN